MLMGNTLPFVAAFVDELDTALREIDRSGGLTPHQKDW